MGFSLKSITKPFKKILKSPIGKAVGLAALYYGMPALGRTSMFSPESFMGTLGKSGWQKALLGGTETTAGLGDILHQKTSPSLLGRFKKMSTLGKAATIGAGTMATGAIGDDVLEEKKTVIDTSGHEGYLNSRKMFIDEWTEWLVDQGHDPDTARAMAEKELFSKAKGGLIGLAQGGRIGMKKGDYGMSPGEAQARGLGAQHHGSVNYADTRKGHAKDLHAGNVPPGGGVGVVPGIGVVNAPPPGWAGSPPPKKSTWNTIKDWHKNYQTRANRNYLMGNIDHYARNKKLAPALLEIFKGRQFDESDYRGLEDVSPIRMQAQFGNLPQEYKDEIRTMSGVVDQDIITRDDIKNWLPSTGGGPGGEGGQTEWQRLGYPSYQSYLAAMQGGGGGGGALTDTVGDYYGFKEWEDWTGTPTTPLFGGTPQYQGLLSKGGRIGLYAGGMGAMNNPMNPMMNQGLGAMGSRGMNPFNQQNLMAQAQMRGQPTAGRPPIPGGPTTAQGPGIASLKPARLPKETQDNELLKLIRMLASMGIPMEQLRGRTKEELVEMVMSLSAKAEAQGGGREEVVEEQEEVVEAKRGGRIGYQVGSDPLLLDEYKKYVFEMEEQGLQPMSFEQFAAEARSGVAHGGRIRAAGGLGEMYPPQGSYPNSDLEFQTKEQASLGNPGDAEMYFEEDEEEEIVIPKARGGLTRSRYAMGTEQPIIPSRDGPQIDYRGIGGYQPHGAKEKKDDVRALLAQGEFVVTSDAVKGIGDGDRDLGAKRMYDMMHKYEPIGRALS